MRSARRSAGAPPGELQNSDVGAILVAAGSFLSPDQVVQSDIVGGNVAEGRLDPAAPGSPKIFAARDRGHQIDSNRCDAELNHTIGVEQITNLVSQVGSSKELADRIQSSIRSGPRNDWL